MQLALAYAPLACRRPPCARNRCTNNKTHPYKLSGPWPGTRGWLSHHLDEGLAAQVQQLVKDATLLDVGAGTGMYGAHFHTLRARGQMAPTWMGFDGSPGVEQYTRANGPPGSLTRHADLCNASVNLPRRAWAMSLEVGEHLPSFCMPTFLRLLDEGNIKGLILSWAVPEQAGSCHISNRPNEVVVSALGVLGFRLMQAETRRARESANYPWFRNTLGVYRRVWHALRDLDQDDGDIDWDRHRVCARATSLYDRAARCLVGNDTLDPACSARRASASVAACVRPSERRPTTYQDLLRAG